MGLTQSQRVLIEKTRSVGAARESERLSEDDCLFLIAVIARDLGLLDAFPEFHDPFPNFFDVNLKERPTLGNHGFESAFEKLVAKDANVDTFFSCLGTLYKARIKFTNILMQQPLPTMDQVGPRGLLQYGTISSAAHTAFLLWRKWLFDIDNRSGQETGYLFEPIIAFAIGGTPVGSRKSPVRRHGDANRGRQVDCIRERRAYEFKVRVTIAASGQGRWREELDFPRDCKASGFIPVLVVLDSTPNSKLTELTNAFTSVGGEVFVGDKAWSHLDSEAGPTMACFLEKYVRAPIEDLLAQVPELLPEMVLQMTSNSINISLGEILSRLIDL